MRVIKGILSNLHRFVLWLLISAFLWGWIFLVALDVPAAKKVTVYFAVPEINETELEAELKKALPQGMRAVEARLSTYDIFSSGIPSGADIVILPESSIEPLIEGLCPIGDLQAEDYYVLEGSVYGAQVYSPASGKGCALRYVTYSAGAEGENCYLCFCKNSKHLGELNGSKDRAAVDVAIALLKLP